MRNFACYQFICIIPLINLLSQQFYIDGSNPWGQDLRGRSDLGGLYFPWGTGSGGVGRFLFFYSSANVSQMFPKCISGVVLAFA